MQPGGLRGSLQFEHRSGEAGDVLAQGHLRWREEFSSRPLERDGAADRPGAHDGHAAGLAGARQLAVRQADRRIRHRSRPGNAQPLVDRFVHGGQDRHRGLVPGVELAVLGTASNAQIILLVQGDRHAFAGQQLSEFDAQCGSCLRQAIARQQRSLAAQDGVLGRQWSFRSGSEQMGRSRVHWGSRSTDSPRHAHRAPPRMHAFAAGDRPASSAHHGRLPEHLRLICVQ